jgi:hypothetical protein
MSPGNAAAPEPESEGETHIKAGRPLHTVPERDSGRDVPRRVPVDHDDDLVVPHTLKHPPRPPVPAAHALRRRVWQGRHLVAVACPWCGDTHWHKRPGNDPSRAVGNRTPPCETEAGRHRQYRVVGDETNGPLT